MQIRKAKSQDIAALQSVLDETDLFPSEMLPDMIASFLNDQASSDIWLTVLDGDAPVGFCYAAPEMLAEGTWNMLAIAVHPAQQGNGRGAALVTALEDMLKASKQRILIADTSGVDAFADTRAFYAKSGYTQEARIRDYWGHGDDKVTYWKALT